MLYDVIIIGGGPAGLTAGIYCCRYGLKTLLIDEGCCEGQISLSPKVENIPGFGSISGIDFMTTLREQSELLGLNILELTRVTKIDKKRPLDKSNAWTVETEDENFEAVSVITCTGCTHRTLGLECEKELIGKGIHFCATCDGPFYKDKDVVVIGGGNSAMVEAGELAKICKTVTIFQNLSELTADQKAIDEVLANDNVKVLCDTVITGYEIFDGKVQGINYCRGDIGLNWRCDGVFLAIGMKPNTELLEEQGITTRNNYVPTDTESRMAENGLFVAGDIRHKSLRQVVTACSDGAVAANQADTYIKNIKKTIGE